jgi:AraC-like DNA-binding protein
MLGTFRNWVPIIDRTLAREGIDLHAELAAAGEVLPADARVDANTGRAIWRLVDACSADPTIAISMLGDLTWLDFEDLGVALVASGSAEAVLARLVRYHALISDVVSISLQTGDRVLDIRIDGRHAHWRSSELTAVLIVRVLRARFGRELGPAEVQLGFDNPAGMERYQRYFRCHLLAGAPDTRLIFDRAALARHCSTEPIGVSERFDHLLATRVSELSSLQTQVGAVRAVLTDTLGVDPPTLARCAAALHVSPRTLQRRLSEEQTNFGAVLDEFRRELAERWLGERRSRTEVAYLLGFSHPSSFSRATARWFAGG